MIASARRVAPLAVLLALVAGTLVAGAAHAAALTMSGRVSTAVADASVKGVQVAVYGPDGSGGWEPQDYVLTRADGSWSTSVQPGRYRVGFSDDRARFTDTFFRTGATVAAAADVAVTTASRTDVDVSLSPRGRVTGTVTLAGKARRGATVTAYVPNAYKWFDAVADTTTGNDGSYSLSLPPGTYRLGFSTPTLPYATEYWKDTPWLSVGTDVVVGSKVVGGLDADLARVPAARGVVTDAAGSPVEGALVSATSSKGGTAETRTGVDGTYALGLAAGTYTLNVSADDYAGEYYDGRTSAGDATPVTMAKADLALRPIVLDRQPAVSGTVRGSTGPLDGIEVSAYTWDADASAWFVVRTSTTAADGSYRLPLSKGTYRLGFDDVDDDVWRNEFWNDASDVDSAADVVVGGADVTGRDVTLAGGDSSGELRGVVTDAGTGRPVEGASVDVLRWDADLEDWAEVGEAARTAASGGYVLRVPRGDYRVRFAAPGYTTELADDAPTPGAARAITVGATRVVVDAALAAPRGSLAGRAADADGPVAGVQVTATRDSDGWQQQTRTGSDGRYRLAVPDGSYTIALDDGGVHRSTYVGGDDLSAARRVTVAGTAVVGVDGTLVLNPTVRGRVLDSTGAAVAGADVTASGEAGDFSVRTGADGRYVLPVQSGDYLLSVTPASGPLGAAALSTEADVTVGSGGLVQDLTVPARPRVSGRVTTSAGRPAVGVRVDVSSTNDDGMSSTDSVVTDADGRWSVVVDPEVDVRVMARGGRLGLGTMTRDLAVGSTSPSSVDLVLAAGQLLGGTVTAPRGDEATVRVYRFESTENAWEAYGDDLTTTSGAYELDVPTGRYRLRATTGERSLFVGGSSFATARDVTVTSGSTSLANDVAFPLPTLTALRRPEVAGLGKSGLTLTVDPGRWSSSTADLSVEWLRDGTPVTGATGRAYVLADADQGASVSARVTARGRGWQAGSAVTGAVSVAGVATRITGTSVPKVSGVAAVGSTLTTTDGGWSVADPTITRQWLRGGQPIDGATSPTYEPTAADQGAVLSVRVTASRDGYVDGVATSAATVPVVQGTIAGRTAPSITGRPAVGETLTASDGTWSVAGVDVRHQWLRDGAPIDGAAGPRLVLGPADVGSTVAVRVTATRDGYAAAVTTAATSAKVAPGELTVTTSPRIDGTAGVGSTLTMTEPVWSADGVTTRREWLRDGSPVQDASGSTLELTPDDLGSVFSVRVSGTKAGYSGATATSAGTGPVAAGRLSVTRQPTVTGTARLGSTLTLTDATWTAGAATSSVQWLRAGQPVTGATSGSYVVGPEDAGSTLSVRVVGTARGYGDLTATSAPTAAVAREQFATAPTPRITGSASRGRTLTAVPGTWAPAPQTMTYQWSRAGRPIAGATRSTYVVATADLGARLTVTTTASAPGYAVTTRTSSAVTVSRTSGKVSGRASAGRGTVSLAATATAAGVTPTGRVQVKLGSRVVRTLTLAKGRASVRLTGLRRGARTFTLVYLGNSQVSVAKHAVRVTVR